MEIRVTCPLGSECEKPREGYVERCAWYTKMAGQTPEGKQVDEWRCALAWMPILSVEHSQQVRGMTAATESFRNETIRGQEVFNNLISSSLDKNIKTIDHV